MFRLTSHSVFFCHGSMFLEFLDLHMPCLVFLLFLCKSLSTGTSKSNENQEMIGSWITSYFIIFQCLVKFHPGKRYFVSPRNTIGYQLYQSITLAGL